MKLLMFALLGVLLFPLVGQAQSQAPVLDRELFFGDPEISGAQLSPDGQYISFVKPFKGTRNVWVKKATEPFSAAKVLTADTKRPVTQYFWARDSKYVLYVQDQGGDENYNVYAVDPTAAPAAGADVPTARNVTDAKGARALIYDGPEERAGHPLHRPQRPRQGVARPLPARDRHRQAHAHAQEHREDRGLGLRQRRHAATGGADDRLWQHRDPACRRQGVHAGLHVLGVRELRSRPLPQGRPARVHGDEQGRGRFIAADPVRSRPPARKNSSNPTR